MAYSSSSFTVLGERYSIAPCGHLSANITVSNDISVCGAVVTYTTPVGTDNCSGPVTTQMTGLASGADFPNGTLQQYIQGNRCIGQYGKLCLYGNRFSKPNFPLLLVQ